MGQGGDKCTAASLSFALPSRIKGKYGAHTSPAETRDDDDVDDGVVEEEVEEEAGLAGLAAKSVNIALRRFST